MVLIALHAPYKLAVALVMVGIGVNGLTGSYGTYLTVCHVCMCIHRSCHPFPVYVYICIKSHEYIPPSHPPRASTPTPPTSPRRSPRPAVGTSARYWAPSLWATRSARWWQGWSSRRPAGTRSRFSCRCVSIGVHVHVCVFIRSRGQQLGSTRHTSHTPKPPTNTHKPKQLGICLLILALLALWVQESLDPRDKPREPFNLWRTHNTFAVLYQFLLTYRCALRSVFHDLYIYYIYVHTSI